MLHHCITCQIYSSLLFVEKCQRASTFRLSPPSRRQQWHCRSSPTSNCGASACQATILKHISGNSLCKPTFTLGIHGGRHQLCSDLHPIAFLTIMSFPLCIFFFFYLVLLGSPNARAWVQPCSPGPSLSRTGWQFHCQRGQKLCQEGGNIWNKRTTDNHCYLSSVHHFLCLTPFKYLTVLNSYRIIWY